MSNMTKNTVSHIITAVIMLLLIGGSTSLMLWPSITLKILAVGILLLLVSMVYTVIYYYIKNTI